MKKWGRILKAVSVCMSIVVLTISLSGCGQKTAGAKGGTRIFFTLTEMDDFRQTFVDGAAQKAAQEGVELVVEDAHGSIEEQVEQLKRAAKENYDVIICSAVSVDTAVQIKMSVGDIPIVFVNSCPEEKHLKEGKYIYVGSDDQVAGAYQSEHVLKKLSGKQELNVVLLKGPKNHSATEGRTKGAKEILNKSGKKINYVFEDNADWDTEKAKKLFALFLSTGVTPDCVICNNDSMAIGVTELCKEKGIDLNNMPVLGVDATADGCEAIKNGDMSFTVYQSGKGQGHAAVEAAMKLAGNGDVKDIEGSTEDGKYVWVDFEPVDSSNVSQY